MIKGARVMRGFDRNGDGSCHDPVPIVNVSANSRRPVHRAIRDHCLGVPVESASPDRDGLRHQPLKILLARVAALCPVRCGRGMLRGRLNLRRGRNSSWRQRARCGSAVPQCIHGQHPGGDCFGHPSAPRCIEAPAARRAAEHLALAAVAARRETPTAPKANEAVGVRVHPQGCRIDS